MCAWDCFWRGCGCGQVRFEFSGEPIKQVFCYCTDCQMRTGGDKWFGIWVPSDDFKYVGVLSPSVYTTKDDSGGDINCYTCPDCGGELRIVGEDVSELLDMIAAQLKVASPMASAVCEPCCRARTRNIFCARFSPSEIRSRECTTSSA